MGIFSLLFGRRPTETRAAQEVAVIEGRGRCSFEVVGESHHQAALERICGGRCEEGHNKECTAYLVPEPDNPHDRNAVRVVIDGETVAYLARADAKAFRERMVALGCDGHVARCNALINGGWERKRGGRKDRGHFGVQLDLG